VPRLWLCLALCGGACGPEPSPRTVPSRSLYQPPAVTTPSDPLPSDSCAGQTGLVVDLPLALDKVTLQAGETLSGTVRYKNCSNVALAVQQVIVAARPPGGTHTGGPFDDLTPAQSATSVAAGATLTVTASRSFSSADPVGSWYSFATWQDSGGAWHDGPDVTFTVTQGSIASSVPANPVAFTKEQPFTLTANDGRNIPYWVYVPQGYDSTHQTPTTLFVFLHGCGGASSGDVWTVSPGGAQSWITVAPGGAEGGCWTDADHPTIVLDAIADIKTHFNIDPKRVILGGYSSGGDLTYQLAFYNAGLFAGTLVVNSTPFHDWTSHPADALAAASWKFNVVHLAHLQDTTYPIAEVRNETEMVKTAGHPMTRIELTGTHWDDANAMVSGQKVAGTDADLQKYLLPYLDAGWRAP
jgi:acetyl esterase/lipase